MTCLHLIADKLARLDAREAACGLPPLAEQDKTWAERKHELTLRVLALPEGERPSIDLVASVGAHALAFLEAIDQAELADPMSGVEAA